MYTSNLHTFSRDDGLKVQTDQLRQWRAVLNDTAYNALVQWVEEQNKKLPKDANGYDVTRGTDLNNFIGNLAIQLTIQ